MSPFLMFLGGGWGSWAASGAAASLRRIWGWCTLPHPGRPQSLVENLSDPKPAASSTAPASACQDSARVMRDHLVTEFRYKPQSAQPVNPGLRNSLVEHKKPPCCPIPGWVTLATLPQEMGLTGKRGRPSRPCGPLSQAVHPLCFAL